MIPFKLFVFLVIPIITVNCLSFDIDNDEEDCEDEDIRVKCPRHWRGFIRIPDSRNQKTKFWCLRLFMDINGTNQPDAQKECASEGGVLSSVDNREEHKYVVKKAMSFLYDNNITSGSIWVDGKRVDSCSNTFDPAVQRAAPCNDKTTVFKMVDDHTDPGYTWKEWYRRSPSWSYWPFRTDRFVTYPVANSTLANCLQMMLIPSRKSRHGQFNDMQCDMAVPRFEYHEELHTNFGRLCGREAKIYDA